jgi:hypothetical protein
MHHVLWLLFGFVLGAAGGCRAGGPARFPVSGEVRFEGQPVQDGIVSLFSRETGIASGGRLDDKGRFTVAEGMPAGSYVVTVRPPPSDVAPPMVAPDPLVAYPNIPKKYWSDTTSDLTATVESSRREPLRFDLVP